MDMYAYKYAFMHEVTIIMVLSGSICRLEYFSMYTPVSKSRSKLSYMDVGVGLDKEHA